jgi:hypothetical protein
MICNGKTLKPILDHVSGNSRDNSPENLRLLCPNCDSQNHETKGGANAGRIKSINTKEFYQVNHRDGIVAAHAAGELFVSEQSIFLPRARPVSRE